MLAASSGEALLLEAGFIPSHASCRSRPPPATMGQIPLMFRNSDFPSVKFLLSPAGEVSLLLRGHVISLGPPG